MSSQWWFARDDMPEGYSRLQSTATAGSADTTFKDAQKLTITVQGAFVRERMDKLSGNDLIIATRHRAGSRPVVDKVHFYQQNVPPLTYEGAFFHPVIFATKDFSEEEDAEITLQVRVYDEDGLSTTEAQGVEGGIESAATAAAVAFPAFAPYAGLATGVGTALLDLISKLDNHDRIVEGRIRLAANKPPNHAYDLLQPGFLICFEQDIDASNLLLGDNNRVHFRSGSDTVEYQNMSYVVLRVTRDFLPTPDYVIDEKAATLLAELESGKGQAGTQAMTFLRETFTAYHNFKRLQRYAELAAKPQLSDDERALLEELKSDSEIKAYLPSVNR